MTTDKSPLTDADHGVIASLNELVRQGNKVAINLLADRYKVEDMDAHEVWAVEKAAERRRAQTVAAEHAAEQRREAGLHGQSRILAILRQNAGVGA